MSSAKIVRGGHVVSMDPAVGDLPTGDVLIRDGTIAGIAPRINADDVEVIDATGMIVLPGFVDTHRHTWQSCVRHRCIDSSPAAYFEEMLFRRGARYRPEDVLTGTLLGALAALESGVTTLVDWAHVMNTPEHSDASLDALEQSGLRAVFAHGWPLTDPAAWMVDSSRSHPGDIVRLRRERCSSDDALITLAMAARGPEMANAETWQKDLQLARSLAIRTTVHMGAFPFNGQKAAISAMHKCGALGEDMTFIHCNCSSAEEFTLIADHGVSVSLGVNVELQSQGIGDLPLDRLLGVGVRPSLSGDTEAIGCGDMFTQMRSALGYYRSWVGGGHSQVRNAPATLTSRDVLSFATIEGARAAGLSNRVGSLTPGKAADLITIRASDLNLAPVSDPVGAVVGGAHPGNVDTVVVNGVVRKSGGKLLGVDLATLRRRAELSQRHVLSDGEKP